MKQCQRCYSQNRRATRPLQVCYTLMRNILYYIPFSYILLVSKASVRKDLMNMFKDIKTGMYILNKKIF